jgi:hypothetical protein
MCTDPDYPDELVYRAHKLCWKIKEGYREMRQHHGFGAFHSRDWNAIYGHLTFTFCSNSSQELVMLIGKVLTDN